MSATHASLAQNFREAGATLHLVNRLDKPLPRFVLDLYFAMKRATPDVVCTFMHGAAGTFGRMCACASGVPRIYHSDRSVNPLVTYLHRVIRPVVDRLTTKILTNAHSTVEWLVGLGVPRQKIVVTPNAIDTRFFDPQHNGTMRKQRKMRRRAFCWRRNDTTRAIQ